MHAGKHRVRSRAVAEHEAGHAAMALALHVPVIRVALTPGGEWTGVCDIGPSSASRIDDAMIDAAGPAADLNSGRFTERWRRHVPRGWKYDFASMRQSGFAPRECRALVDLAAALLHGRLGRLHAKIVDALLERDLGPEDLEALFVGDSLD